MKEGDDEESLEKERESYLIWILSWKKASRLKEKKKTKNLIYIFNLYLYSE